MTCMDILCHGHTSKYAIETLRYLKLFIIYAGKIEIFDMDDYSVNTKNYFLVHVEKIQHVSSYFLAKNATMHVDFFEMFDIEDRNFEIFNIDIFDLDDYDNHTHTHTQTHTRSFFCRSSSNLPPPPPPSTSQGLAFLGSSCVRHTISHEWADTRATNEDIWVTNEKTHESRMRRHVSHKWEDTSVTNEKTYESRMRRHMGHEWEDIWVTNEKTHDKWWVRRHMSHEWRYIRHEREDIWVTNGKTYELQIRRHISHE